jgi:hypothetical protein
MSRFSLVIDEACGEIPERWKTGLLPRMGANTKIGEAAEIHQGGRKLYLHRKRHSLLWLTVDNDGAKWAAKKEDYSWAGPLWKLLEDGADTPEDRRALAFGLKVPCGKCAIHWRQVLRDRPPPLESNEAFRAWAQKERNNIARSKGLPTWPAAD